MTLDHGRGRRYCAPMDALRDVAYAWRHCRRAPGFTAAATLTFALGIGITTAVLTVANAVLLRPLPFPNADRLVRIVEAPSAGASDGGAKQVAVEPEEFAELRDTITTLSHLGVYTSATATLTGRGDAEPLSVTHMSASFFGMLGATPALGRDFGPSEEAGGPATVVVLSHRVWQRIFQGATDALGQIVEIDGQPVTVIGVMPPGFGFPDALTDAWMPFRPTRLPGRSQRFALYGALAPGVPLSEASAAVSAALQDLRGFPLVDEYRAAGERLPFELVTWKEDMVAPVRPALVLLTVMAALVLLLACVNIATLLLARGTARHREIATRVALGASPGRIVRQLVTESLVLAMGGGVAGLALTATAVRGIAVLGATLERRDFSLASRLPRLEEVHIDVGTLAIVLGLAVVSALVAGLWPALRLTHTSAAPTSWSSPRVAGAGSRRFAALGLLVMAQVALSTALLVSGIQVMTSFVHVLRADLGFETDHLLTFRVAFPAGRYSRESLEAFNHRVIDALGRGAGVEAAAYSSQLPFVRSMAGAVASTVPTVPGGEVEEGPTATRTVNDWVHHEWFHVMGLRIVNGRSLAATDDARAPQVVVVNEALVQSGLLGDAPVGRRLYFGAGSEPWEVVGVVQNFVRFGLGEPERPAAYFDARQRPALPGMPGRGPYVVVKTQQPGLDSLGAIRAAVRAADADATVIDVATMDDIVGSVRARPRLYAALTTVFAAAALLIAAAGIAGVVAYVVAQRRKETGIRLSLGATPARVVGEFVAEAAWRTAAGTVAGLAVAAGLATWLRGILFGVQPPEPGAFVGAAIVIAIVTVGAAGIPARRAARVNPAESLRAE